jgi:hypothetical protein
VVPVKADLCRKRQVRTHADEHAAPALVVYVDVLHHPALRDLQMPAVLLLVPDRDHDACGLAAFHDRDHLVRFCFPEVQVEELVRDLGYADTAQLIAALEEVIRLLTACRRAILASSSSDS